MLGAAYGETPEILLLGGFETRDLPDTILVSQAR
jgi:hypothetical protein